MGKIYNSPNNYVYPWKEVSIFLAGGITGAPDWQGSTALQLALDTPDHIVIFNPRREGTLDIKDEDSAREQIAWEYAELNTATIKFFWFPKEAQCMITLFELGKELMRAKSNGDDTANQLFIGVEPGYVRELDITIQVELMYPDFLIYDSLSEMTDTLIRMINHV